MYATKQLTFLPLTNDTSIYVSNTQVENVESYFYLEQRYSTKDKNQDEEIKSRITVRWKVFVRHRDIFSGYIGTCLKRQVINSCVLTATTWALTTQVKNKLAAAQTKIEMSVLNITYRVRKTNEKRQRSQT